MPLRQADGGARSSRSVLHSVRCQPLRQIHQPTTVQQCPDLQVEGRQHIREFWEDTETFDWLVEHVQCSKPRRPAAQIRGSLLNNLKPPSRSAGGPSRTPVLSRARRCGRSTGWRGGWWKRPCEFSYT